MGVSKRLRIKEFRNLYQLLGECCELGADPLAWRGHMAEHVAALFDAQIGEVFEVQVVANPFDQPFWLTPLMLADFGWPTPSDRHGFEAHLATGRPEDGPHITPDLLDRRLKIVHWSGQQGRSAWHRSMFFNEFVKTSRLDDGIFAHHLVEPGQMRWVLVNRALGDRPFAERDGRLMTLLNLEQARLLGTKLARLGEPSVTDLSPRLREVLISLMEGDGEKQVALRLGISRHTVHDYVKSLHDRFGVRSRGELLSRCRAFWPVLDRMLIDHADAKRNGH
jgi:DNA-binding CsgD family transcriptional regulator